MRWGGGRQENSPKDVFLVRCFAVSAHNNMVAYCVSCSSAQDDAI